MEISRGRKPPVTHTRYDEPRQGRRNVSRDFRRPGPGAWINVRDAPVVCSRRGDLISNVPSGQVAVHHATTWRKFDPPSPRLRRGRPQYITQLLDGSLRGKLPFRSSSRS